MSQADLMAEFERQAAVRTGDVIKRAGQALIAERARALRAFDLTTAQYHGSAGGELPPRPLLCAVGARGFGRTAEYVHRPE